MQLIVVFTTKSGIIEVMKPTPLDKAIAMYPTLLKFSEEVGVSYQVVQKWRKTGVPPKHCLSVELATNHEVTRAQLRPDIFGVPPIAKKRNISSDSSKPRVRN